MVPSELLPRETSSSESLEEKYHLHAELERLLQQKHNLSFDKLVAIAKKIGFEFRQKRSSHLIGRHPTHEREPGNGGIRSDMINLQEKDGKAKTYQVVDVVTFARDAQPKGRSNG